MRPENLVKGNFYNHPVYGLVKYIGKKVYNGIVEYEFWEGKNYLFHFIDPSELKG